MATTPLVYGPDGVLRNTLNFSTTQDSRFFTGTTSTDTIDMEVAINGSGYTADPDLIYFTGTTWISPNPAAYPNGLELSSGKNTLQVRAIETDGSVSGICSIYVRLVQESDLGTIASPPTNIFIEQHDASVNLYIEGLTIAGFQGFNLYASAFPGGGGTGYQQVNITTITNYTTYQEITELAAYEIDAQAVPDTDPLYYQVVGQQTNYSEDVLQEDFSEKIELSEDVTDIRINTSISSVREISQYIFSHNRLAGPTSTPPTVASGSFAALSNESYLYYVATAVFFDEEANLEFESAYSQEIVGRPLKIRANIDSFPVVSRQKIVQDYITSVFRSNPQVKVEEGSTLRDIVIDPFALEAERVRFIVDFLHRCSAPALLLAIDDPKNTGESSDVNSTPYKLALKQAFRLGSNTEVQAMIDAAFDAYASNFGVIRRPGRPAQGEITFFTTTQPTRTLSFPLGTIVQGGSYQYMTTRAGSIPLNQLASYFNPVTRRYSVTVPVKATATGAAGNLGRGQVRQLVSPISGVSVTNNAAMFGGENQETNNQLMERAQRALASVDSGTKQGYIQTAADVPGVVQAQVVVGGNDFMQRDLDSSGVHRGGKVDIWVQGENLSTVTDTFAFSYEIGQDIQFEVVGAPANYLFRAVDPNLSEDNPIVEMLDYPDAGYIFKDVTTGFEFDLTDVTITSFNTIQLSTDGVQPPVSLTDVVLGSYRRRLGNVFIPSRQPVSSVSSVVGVSSGTIDSDYYALYHPDDPLQKGRSYLASDYLLITAHLDSVGNTVPSGDMIQITDEPHVLIGEYPEYLDNLGGLFLTVEVWNNSKTVEFVRDTDFIILLGTQTTPVAIQRLETGSITSGQSVLVSYKHDENFTVTYKTDLIVSVTQGAVENSRHATADVLVKAAIPVPVDISATVVVSQGADTSVVDQDLRTNLTNFLKNFRLGVPVRQSDIINVIEQTSGVSYVLVPLSKMSRGDGTPVLWEALTTNLSTEITPVTSLSTDSVLVWLIQDSLSSSTTNGGGTTTDFRGVFQDDVALSLLGGTAQLQALSLAVGRSFIIGANGTVIQGISDDTTLINEGYLTAAERVAARIALTGNRILVSTLPSDSPINHQYTVTYVASSDRGTKDIDPGEAEYLTVGDMVFTYDEDSV